MSEFSEFAVLAVADIGATQTRVDTADMQGTQRGTPHYGATNRDIYEGTILGVAESMLKQADGRPIAAASLVIAATVDHATNRLTAAGHLSPWAGRQPSYDLAEALRLPPTKVGLLSDVEAIAASQSSINVGNLRRTDGFAATVSSGLGGAFYRADGTIQGREWGHTFLREGGVCPCGQMGCTEAFVSGKGALLNTGTDMKTHLEVPANRDLFVDDLATAVVGELGTLEKEYRFVPREWRWTGGVALNRPDLMLRVADEVRARRDGFAPAFDTVTMGDRAGLHGSISDARERAIAGV